jgi:hypothetical protein
MQRLLDVLSLRFVERPNLADEATASRNSVLSDVRPARLTLLLWGDEEKAVACATGAGGAVAQISHPDIHVRLRSTEGGHWRAPNAHGRRSG